MVRAWQLQESARWRPLVEGASASGGLRTLRDSALAAGLVSMATREYDSACPALTGYAARPEAGLRRLVHGGHSCSRGIGWWCRITAARRAGRVPTSRCSDMSAPWPCNRRPESVQRRRGSRAPPCLPDGTTDLRTPAPRHPTPSPSWACRSGRVTPWSSSRGRAT
jgi:hypothetical protein